MKLIHLVVALALAVAAWGPVAAQAQTALETGAPAELPPESYTGRQYVDSQGCVFVRAGIDGNVTWVPRLTSARKVLCGQPPSLPTARAPAPDAQPAPRASPAAVPAAPKPARKATRRAQQGNATRAPGKGAVGVALRPVVVPMPVPVAVPVPVHVTRVPMPPMYRGTSYAVGGYATAPVLVVDPHATRVAPRHVARGQRAAEGVAVPDGYKRVWMDGRLNPHRAHQTVAGIASARLMWTSTVPRRLILADTGREVTALYPGLAYPYTSYGQQRAATGQVATVPARPRQPAAVPKARPGAQAAGHSYVQAGVFASRAQALHAARRLAGTGLPIHLGRMTRDGTVYSLLLTGPFSSAGALDAALTQVRGAGFGNARLR
jgi:hypothetical protein